MASRKKPAAQAAPPVDEPVDVAPVEETPPTVEFELVESVVHDDHGELPLNGIEFALAGRLIRLEAGERYATADVDEIRALDARLHVRRAG